MRLANGAGLQLHLASLRRSHPDQLASGPEYEGNVIVHPSAKIGKDCKIGPNVSIGIGCELENGVRVANAVLLHRVKVHTLLSQRSAGHQENFTSVSAPSRHLAPP